VCQAQANETRTRECPNNMTGAITQTRTWNMQSCAWNGWAQTSSTCTCTPNTQTREIDCANGQTGKIKQSRSVECPGANWSAWKEDSNNCTCEDVTETRVLDCAIDQAGEITETRIVECNGTPKTAWFVSENTCKPKVCRWRKGSPGSGTIGPTAGTDCECGTRNRACREDIGDGLYQGYNNCSCQ
jgi:hypothetical protein